MKSSILKASSCAVAAIAAIGIAGVARALDVYSDLTFQISDFGINQPWSATDAVGEDFGPGVNRYHDVFDQGAGRVARLLVPMPTDRELSTLGPRDLKYLIENRLEDQVKADLDRGYRQFDIQLVEHISGLGYVDSHRQAMVNEFGAAAYGALSDVVGGLAPKTRPGHLAVFGTFGSNGTAMFTRSSAAWAAMEDYIGQITLVNGRANENDVFQTLAQLPPEKLRIIDSRRDLWAPLGSIALTTTAEDIQRRYPAVTLLLLNKKTGDRNDAHINSMADPVDLFNVRQLFSINGTSASVDLGEHPRREIHPFLTTATLSQVQGRLPPVWRAVGPPADARGGVLFSLKPVYVSAPKANLAAKVLRDRPGAGGAWDITSKER